MTQLCFWQPEEQDAIGRVELAFSAMLQILPLEKRVQEAQKAGRIPTRLPLDALLQAAKQADVLTDDECAQWQEADRLRYQALQVDVFAPGELEQMGC